MFNYFRRSLPKPSFAQAFKGHAFAKNESHKWSMIGDFFYKKPSRWKPHRFHMTPGSPLTISSNFKDSGDEFLRKFDEEAAKQKGRKM